MKPRIYVSAPMTGLPELNFPAIRAATTHLRSLGFEVVCPTEIPAPVRPDGGEPTHADWMRASLCRLATCHVMVQLPRWVESAGCLGENRAADDFGVTVISYRICMTADDVLSEAHYADLGAAVEVEP